MIVDIFSCWQYDWGYGVFCPCHQVGVEGSLDDSLGPLPVIVFGSCNGPLQLASDPPLGFPNYMLIVNSPRSGQLFILVKGNARQGVEHVGQHSWGPKGVAH